MQIFISHSTTDKDTIVSPIVENLQRFGINVWYDEFCISAGDTISSSVFDGAKKSTACVFIITKSFVQKKWTNAELQIFIDRAIRDSIKIIPVLVDIEPENLYEISPYLATKLAIKHRSALETSSQIAISVLKEVPKEIVILGKKTRIWYHCPYCATKVWGEAPECPGCRKSFINGGRTSIYELIKKRIGLPGAIVFLIGLLSIQFMVGKFLDNYIYGAISLFPIIYFVYRSLFDKIKK